MKLKYGDLTIPCKVGETIKFELKPAGTAHSVIYNLGDKTNPIPADKTFGLKCEIEAYRSSPLVMILNFSEPAGGKYEITAIRQGSSIGSFTVSQPSGSSMEIIRFGLEGDPYTDYD